jgi:hypothetical protein
VEEASIEVGFSGNQAFPALLKRLMGKSKYVGIFHCHQWKIPIMGVEKIVRFP